MHSRLLILFGVKYHETEVEFFSDSCFEMPLFEYMGITYVFVHAVQKFPCRQIKLFLRMLSYLVGFKVIFQMQSIRQLRVWMFMLLVHDSLVELLYTLKHRKAISGSNNDDRTDPMNWENMAG